MPYSHHSHSGQFCSHGKNTLEEMVQTAITKGFHTFCLTEHIPRHKDDFYPDEEALSSEEGLVKLFDDFHHEATRLRAAHPQMRLLIGFESEWIRPSSLQIIQDLFKRYTFDLFVGSVHHVHTVPIDYDKATYEKARERAGGTDEKLFEDYFDSQYEMLQALKPPIVGHFDLIRLLSDKPDAQFKDLTGVWDRMERNLGYIASYGGILELNASGLRKGLAQPYPCLPVCEMFLRMGGRFAMSDDSHSIDQVGTNYHRMLAYIQELGLQELYYVDRDASSIDTRFPHAGVSSVTVGELATSAYWTTNQ